ncbi:CPBP family intramembrane glutamic endopeptidase [Anaeromyxobacter sp. Fw109-5]|uniref:CPBP family intramembrane glutamic endopeptidase n=1 Tax=Anaeromyxobacter sp. (strain Fw109-5) TaxID=404589 RepID=UPI0000ED7564|nr:type II CAAX endopeptidase family protein [Anaeromyxobacter sp. Fw109-5]ABS26612.1 Abortive infection protein [Anaeromyxobacter sp. Fw109-5]
MPPPPSDLSRRRAGLGPRLAGFVAAFLAATLAARGVRLLLTGRARLAPGPAASAEPYFLLYRLTGVAAVLLASWLALRFLESRRLADLGLGGGVRKAAYDGARGATLASGIFVAGFAALLVTGHARIVGTTLDWRALALQAAPATLLVGLYEELLFRGYLFQAIVERLRPWPAILLVSGVFGAIHYPNPGVTALGAAATALYGVLLGALLVRTRSLWTCIGFHFAGNLVQAALLGSRASGMSFGASILSVDYRPTLFAGAPSGLEAAAPTLLVALLALAWVLRCGAWSARDGARVLWSGAGPPPPTATRSGTRSTPPS